jgi:prepilin signal peptidase PulO-like enzyme (type II secretory pathway)
MSVFSATAATVATIAALAAIAKERMRAYSLEQNLLDARAVAIAVLVTTARGWLAARGIGSIDTSVSFATSAVAAMTDLRCGYVFDRVLLTGGAALIALEAWQGRFGPALIGGAAGASAMAIPWALSRARGMGFGDVKLAAVLGCALGPYGALRALWFAFVVGALVAVASIVTRRHTPKRTLPFAPFLALGAMLSTGSAAW